MGVLTFIGRIVLVVFHLIFVVVALCLVLLGFIVRFGQDTVKPYVDDVLSNIQETIEKFDKSNTTTFDTSKFDLGDMVGDFCAVLIVVGLVLLAFGLVGFIGACCNLTTLMLIDAIILIVLLLGQVAIVAMAFGKPDMFVDYMAKGMHKSLEDYDGLNGTSASALGWNWAMQEFDCCGVESYKDFNYKYQANDRFEDGDVLTPIACCKELPNNNSLKEQCAGKVGGNFNSTDAIKDSSNYETGCANAVWERATTAPNSTYVLVGIVFAFVFQIVLIIFAILGYKNRGIKGGVV